MSQPPNFRRSSGDQGRTDPPCPQRPPGLMCRHDNEHLGNPRSRPPMRPIGVGLAIALVLGVLAPATVMSASKKAAEIPAAARKQGMAEAPAIVQAAGLGCQVTDA